jgi:putative aminotransferase
MANVEVMKERARITGRFNLSARRNPEHRALVALAAQKAGGEYHVIPAAPGEDEADVLHHVRRVSGGKPVIIVTEADGELYVRLSSTEVTTSCKGKEGLGGH